MNHRTKFGPWLPTREAPKHHQTSGVLKKKHGRNWFMTVDHPIIPPQNGKKIPKLGSKTQHFYGFLAEGLGGDYNWDMHQMIQIWQSIDQELAGR